MSKFYDFSKSPLFSAGPRKVAQCLGVEKFSDLDVLANLRCEKRYRFFKVEERLIEQPCPSLDRIQKRIARFLSRLEPPDYLHSGVKKRSYRSNAERHLPNRNSFLFTMDIKKFFPSTTEKSVWAFFANELNCDRDIASVLAKLCTVNGHIPTGSSLSTILSFYAYRSMFDSLNLLATEQAAQLLICKIC